MVELVIDARRRSIGAFEVGRVLPWAKRRMVGPFIFFDHMGPIDFPAPLPPDSDVRPHPHIGLATVTYLFRGEIMHRDSTGVTQLIKPGEVNWMTAGRGITHSERFDTIRDTGGPLHGIQAWVALPDAEEYGEPGFEHFGIEALPVLDETGAKGRLVAGDAYGVKSGVRGRSPLHYVHFELAPGARVSPPTEHSERAAYVVRGAVTCDRQGYQSGQMLVFARNETPTIEATAETTLILIGGEPVGERFLYWNFVASSQARLEEAKADWRGGRFALPPNDKDEFIPLPAE